MNRRIKAAIVVEIFILLALFVHIARTPRMWIVLALAILFTVLANALHMRFFRLLSLVFWCISALVLFMVSWFWLAIIFPAIMCLVFWKNTPRSSQNHQAGQGFTGFSGFSDFGKTEPDFHDGYEDITDASDFDMADENVKTSNGNDVIDLEDMRYRPSGNTLTIKKVAGNTKIIVPNDVAVMLDFAVHSGIVKIFDETAKVNPGNLRYFSDGFDSSHKKVRLILRVETGNVEVVRG